MLPFLIFGIAAIGLNILTGYCGQVSLGSAVYGRGAYACYKLMTAFPDLNLIICIVLSGGVTAMVGILFGLPSLRIKGFYLAVATLAAQFFLVWLFNKVGWFYNYSPRPNQCARKGISRHHHFWTQFLTRGCVFGLPFLLTVLALIARNLTRGHLDANGWRLGIWISPQKSLG